MNLINEISSWESELESLRSEVKILRESKILLDFEIDQLRRRNTRLEERLEHHITRHVQLKTQLERTCADLVKGMQKVNDENREIDIAADEPRLIERAAE